MLFIKVINGKYISIFISLNYFCTILYNKINKILYYNNKKYQIITNEE